MLLNDYNDHLKIANMCLTNYSDEDSYDARKKSILALLNNEKLCKKYIPGPIHTLKTIMKQYDTLMLKLKGHLCLLSTIANSHRFNLVMTELLNKQISKQSDIDKLSHMHSDRDQMYEIFNTCSIDIKSFIIKINFNLVMKELIYISSFRNQSDEILFVDIGSFINRLDFRSLMQKLPEIESFEDQKQYMCNILINHMNNINYDILHYDEKTKSYPYTTEDLAIAYILYYNRINFIHCDNWYCNTDQPLKNNTLAIHTNMYRNN